MAQRAERAEPLGQRFKVWTDASASAGLPPEEVSAEVSMEALT